MIKAVIFDLGGVYFTDGTKIFELSLKQTKEKPEYVFFIDDNEEHVKTAKKLRMNVIHFKNSKQLKTELKKFMK